MNQFKFAGASSPGMVKTTCDALGMWVVLGACGWCLIDYVFEQWRLKCSRVGLYTGI